jgi:hypothetical protein
MADDLTFTDVVDFLSDREGGKVYVEIGTRDVENQQQPADAFILKLHGHRLGKVEDATDESGERSAPMIRLEPIDTSGSTDDDNETRLFINPGQVTRIEGVRGQGLKVWLDDTLYIGLM